MKIILINLVFFFLTKYKLIFIILKCKNYLIKTVASGFLGYELEVGPTEESIIVGGEHYLNPYSDRTKSETLIPM